MSEFFVEILERATDKVEVRVPRHGQGVSRGRAEKIQAGAERNLDHARYYTRLVDQNGREQ